MQSHDNTLECTACGTGWKMDWYGVINKYHYEIFVPDWYRWEREKAEEEAAAGYDVSFRVAVEALPNEKGFVPLGTGVLRHSYEGFELSLDEPFSGLADEFPLKIPSRCLESVQTEYNYRGKGKCIVLSSRNCCYYCYSDDPLFLVTKMEFITEYLYRKQS